MKPRKVAFLFPGQGAEQPGMGLALAQRSEQAACWLRRVSDLTGCDAWTLLQRGGPGLDRTDVLQPLLTAVSLISLHALTAAGVTADVVAGHSLGEVAALCAVDSIDALPAIDLAHLRGHWMAQAAQAHPGAMLALSLSGWRECLRVVHAGRRGGVVDVAAHNAPGQWVLCGERAALRAIASRHPGASWLPVSGAWHGRFLRDVVPAFREALHRAVLRPARVPLVVGRSGRVGSDLTRSLSEQVARPVHFCSVLATLQCEGTTDVVTVGPGKILRGLLRANLGTALRIHASENEDDVMRTRIALLEPLSG